MQSNLDTLWYGVNSLISRFSQTPILESEMSRKAQDMTYDVSDNQLFLWLYFLQVSMKREWGIIQIPRIPAMNAWKWRGELQAQPVRSQINQFVKCPRPSGIWSCSHSRFIKLREDNRNVILWPRHCKVNESILLLGKCLNLFTISEWNILLSWSVEQDWQGLPSWQYWLTICASHNLQ